jgi:hypothetical protein
MQNDLFSDEELEQIVISIPSSKVLYRSHLYHRNEFIQYYIKDIDKTNQQILRQFKGGADVTSQYQNYLDNRTIQFNYHWQQPEDVADHLHIPVDLVIQKYKKGCLQDYANDQVAKKLNRQIQIVPKYTFSEMLNNKIDIFKCWNKRWINLDKQDDEEAKAISQAPYIYQDLFLYKLPNLKLRIPKITN